ncbi:MAG: chromosomal replication initiator protein DnaA [Christensenellales bacterium]
MDTFLILWERALEILKQDLVSVRYDTWIKTLSPVSKSENKYYFQTLNPVHKELVDKSYKNIIINAMDIAMQSMGIDSQEIIVIFLDTEEAAKIKQQQKNQNENANIEKSMLNPAFTFDSFVVGSSNEFAHAAAVAVAENPGYAYNPLFIYGKTGLGKTHLMQAIANYISDRNSGYTVMYVKSEPFLNDLIHAIRTSKTEEFRRRYRKADVLLIDDIQFIAGKESTQEEFFHTFNDLHENDKQIILSSDKPPKEIPLLEERLQSRFEGGLIADVQPPNYETKLAILIKKAKDITSKDALKCEVNHEILDLIATKVSSNIRSLEGALKKIIAYTVLNGKTPNLVEAEIAIRDFLTTTTTKKISSKHILQLVCEYYELSEDEIVSNKKSQSIAYPRQVAMYLTRKLMDISYKSIAEIYGKSDHTTVIYAYDKIEREMTTNIELKTLLDDFIIKLKE